MREGRDRPAGRPGGARPAGRQVPSTRPSTRRAAAGRAASVTRTSAPKPRGWFAGRAIILGVVLVALALSYVFPLRIYLTQQAEIAALREAQAAQRAHIQALAEEAARWEDDAYVRVQARKRLRFVEPGDVPLIVVWEEEAAEPVTEPEGPPAPPQEPKPWWDVLWASVEAADRGGPVGQTPAAQTPAGQQPAGQDGGDSDTGQEGDGGTRG